MWDERLSLARAFAEAINERDLEATLEVCHPEIEFFSLMAQLEASPYRGFGGIRRYFRDIDGTWEEWRVEVEQLSSAPDGRVMIVMSTHGRTGLTRMLMGSVAEEVVRKAKCPVLTVKGKPAAKAGPPK